MTAINRRCDDDRLGPPESSPFRLAENRTRFVSAAVMVAKRQRELTMLEAMLGQKLSAKQRRALRLRISASKRNLDAWVSYMQDDECPLEPRAVITP